jgi:hypothetical protein
VPWNPDVSEAGEAVKPSRACWLAGIVAAAAVGAVLVRFLPGHAAAEGALVALLAAAAGARPVRAGPLRGPAHVWFAPTHAFVLYALAVLGPGTAGLVALASVAGTAACRRSFRDPQRLVFNLGAVMLSTAVAGMLFALAGGEPAPEVLPHLLPLACAAAAFLVVNTVLIAFAVSLERGVRWGATWVATLAAGNGTYLAGCLLAAAMLALRPVSPYAPLVLGAGAALLAQARAAGGRRGTSHPTPEAT